LDVRTHDGVDPALSGRPLQVSEGRALVELRAIEAMLADDSGLIHGGFVFSLADHAAMLAVNHPNVVLGQADVRFTKPVVLGDLLLAEAQVEESLGMKYLVRVEVRRGEEAVLSGQLTCFVLERHVLDPS
jgi:acyl-coenzyme A thioesterase PaaI-like protein